MNIPNCIRFFAPVFLVPLFANSQYIEVNDTFQPQQLVENVLINSPCANVSNITATGFNAGDGNSFGYFSAGSSSFPFPEGIVLTTGKALSAIGPNSTLLSEGPVTWSGDSDLEQALSISGSINATVLEFDFLPYSSHVSFRYIFSSEQYLSNPSANQCNFTDGFAFLLRAVNSQDQYENLAVVPGTSIPVKVNTIRGSGTVCPAANEQFFGGFNSVNHPTNYNGQTVILTAQATVVPNQLYHIKLVIADQGNNLYDSAIFLGGGSFEVGTDVGEDRLVSLGNPVCGGDSVILDATEPGSNLYQWFKDGVAIAGATSPTFTVTSAGLYRAEVSLGASGCVAKGEAMIEYAANPAAGGPYSIVQCDDNADGSTTYDLTTLNSQFTSTSSPVFYQTFTDAQNQINPITNPGSYQSGPVQVFVRVAGAFGCSAVASVNLQIANNNVPDEIEVAQCDTDSDGVMAFDLTQSATPILLSGLPTGLLVQYYETLADAISQQDPLPGNFTNTVSNQQTVYARIINGGECFGITRVKLKVEVFNPGGFEDETVYLCLGSSATIELPAGYQEYQWNGTSGTNQLMVTAAGIYTGSVTSDGGCVRTKVFTVLESAPPVITGLQVNDLTGGSNNVTINYSGTGDYQFSIDGQFFQSSPYFANVSPGEYTAIIADAAGCGQAGPEPFLILDYPRFFTPNGDGINDVWEIKNFEARQNSTLSIFDRYGKLVYSFKAGQAGWNGTFSGQQLPSTDYWFVLSSAGSRTIKSHFTLKR